MENKSVTTNDPVNVFKPIRELYAPNLLSNKTALVTGGSRGIGRAIAIV